MNRLNKVCSAAREAKRKLLVPYLVAGDPDIATTLTLMHELVKQGADVIELGFPFSDPASDGPVIQRAIERALAAGTKLSDVLALVKRFRSSDPTTPVVLMGYLNPVEIMGYEKFADSAADSGVDGVLIVDMPPGESAGLKTALRAQEIESIFLVAPTTTEKRTKAIVAQCSGYLYYVSLKGVTGAALSDEGAVGEKLSFLRQQTDLPIVIGFGIKDGASAKAMAILADGIVIGSALVSQVALLDPAAGISDSQIADTTAIIRQAREVIDSIS